MYNNVCDLISFIESLKRNENKENLDYMYSLCDFFGNPQNKVKLIHIGGTNGKGSTVSFLKHILIAAGYNVGTFISPYVVCFNERITYNNNYISDEDLLKYGNIIISKFAEIKKSMRLPSFFEFMTLLSFLYFAELENLDYAIIEVGIGGKLDSTNVINPLISAVTNVSYDHVNMLGPTLDEIWDNKLGIVKPNTIFVVLKNEEFLDKIKLVCNEKNAPLIIIDQENIKNPVINKDETIFDYLNFSNLSLKLLGYHQIENAILALEIARNIPQLTISDTHIYQGLKNATWPGRIEKVSENPLVFIDGAHNIDGITRLADFLKTIKDRPIRIVFAVSSNKDKEQMIKIIEKIADEIIFTSFSYYRKENSTHLFNMSLHQNKKQLDDLDEIIKIVYENKNIMTVFCGSLFLISEIRNKFINKV
ncbi:MAG TPA: bifunctional folylpolyglutamate synthase/dihydrofolate synthase [Acholeplasmataceae bacterium]|nr:bifunctional folylpolyglutamate synthase/dihydrofolate synthase [Acholeplasmataceae bacterium]